MARRKKLVDPKQYCRYLIDPPVADEEVEYPTWMAKELYNCTLNQEPCVARYIEDRTADSDIFAYARPEIDENELSKCPLHSIPKDVAEQTIIAKINSERDMEIAELKKRLKDMD